MEQKVLELLGDPDSGLEVRPEIAERIRCTLAEVEQGKRYTPAEDVAKEVKVKTCPHCKGTGKIAVDVKGKRRSGEV